MATLFTIKQNDTRPKLVANLQSNGANLSLATATSVKFMMRAANGGATKVNAAAVITDSVTGEVTYTWISADTDTVGTYEAEWQVLWNDGGVETFPNAGYNTIVVTDDIAT